MAAPDPARTANHPPAAGTADSWLNLFLDSKPEGQNAPGDLPLMHAKPMLPCCDYDGEMLSVLEFFAVGKTFRALFWRAVKGGGNCRFLTYLQFSRF